jgi:hypothetical protein
MLRVSGKPRRSGYTYTHTHTHTYTQVHTHTHTQIHTHTHTCIHAHVYTCTQKIIKIEEAAKIAIARIKAQLDDSSIVIVTHPQALDWDPHCPCRGGCPCPAHGHGDNIVAPAHEEGAASGEFKQGLECACV